MAGCVSGRRLHDFFWHENGTLVLARSEHLPFAAATSDAINVLIEVPRLTWHSRWGQILFDELYAAGSHTYDTMVIKPIFYQKKLIARTPASRHTTDTGGLLRGGATEIFH